MLPAVLVLKEIIRLPHAYGQQSMILPFHKLCNIFQNSLKYICGEANMRTAHATPQPLDFLKLLAHDIRWRIVLALSRSDQRVEELVKRINHPHNLISYHL